jgi:predicted nucleotidyltransferase
VISLRSGSRASIVLKKKGLAGIEYAFIFGSIAKDQEYSGSDIDLMLIGEADQDDLINKIQEFSYTPNYSLKYKQKIVNKEYFK